MQRVVRIIYNGWQFAQQTPLYHNYQFAANHTLVYSTFWCHQCFCFSPTSPQQSTLNSPQQTDRNSPTFCRTIWRISASWANRICSSSSCLQPLCPVCLVVQTVVCVDTQVLLHYISTSCHRLDTGCVAVLFLLKSITNSLVFFTFRSKRFFPDHSTKSSTSSLYSSSCPSL